MLKIAALLLLLLPHPAAAQPRVPDMSWVERDWSALEAPQRSRAVRRFGRDQERDARPDRLEMQARWDAMTPGQRRELMLGPRRAPRDATLAPPRAATGAPPRAERLPRPPPAAPRPGLVAPPPAAPPAPQGALRPSHFRA